MKNMKKSKNYFAEGRDVTMTDGLSDYQIAAKFYNYFDVPNNFGKIIHNTIFSNWIYGLNFVDMRHGFGTKAERSAWSSHRRYLRDYIKRGVLTKLYADSGREPFCVEVKEHGQNVIIVRLEDSVVDKFNMLASKRKKNIKNQDKTFKKDFKAITDLFNMDRIDAIMQYNIIDAQNKMRIAFEESCGEILKTTVKNTMKSIADSKAAVKRITDESLSHFDDN